MSRTLSWLLIITTTPALWVVTTIDNVAVLRVAAFGWGLFVLSEAIHYAFVSQEKRDA